MLCLQSVALGSPCNISVSSQDANDDMLPYRRLLLMTGLPEQGTSTFKQQEKKHLERTFAAPHQRPLIRKQ